MPETDALIRGLQYIFDVPKSDAGLPINRHCNAALGFDVDKWIAHSRTSDQSLIDIENCTGLAPLDLEPADV